MLLEQATPGNVSRAFFEINAFEWEGDFKPMARQALKELLEKRLSQTQNSPHGCDGPHPELTTNRFRCVSSSKPKLESATPKIYTQLLTLPAAVAHA